MGELTRFFDAVANVVLPGPYRPLVLGTARVGFLAPEVAVAAGLPAADVCDVADATGLAALERRVQAAGLFGWRGEAFDVRAEPGGVVLGQVDRGALPVLGIGAEGVHVNGFVRRADGGVSLWVATRSRSKALDPGLLDHLVAGGICAGMDAAGTLEKEAWEEAGVPAGLARRRARVSSPAEQLFDVGQLQLDIGRAAVIALA